MLASGGRRSSLQKISSHGFFLMMRETGGDMPTKVTIGGTVPVLTDKGVQFVEWIEFDGRAWITGPWLVESHGKSRRPLRIIAPRFAAGFAPLPGPGVLGFFEKIQVPNSLLAQGHLPSGLARQLEVRENPDVCADIQSLQ